MIVQEPIQAAIWHCLNNYAYNDAVFLSERLYAEVKSDDSLYLLATSYFRSGLRSHAYAVLKAHAGLELTSQCRYLLACCALELNRYSEAEAALLGEKNLDDIIQEFGDQAAFALQLLAKICVKTERKGIASEAFKKALKINPFLWTCFVDLCNKGEKCDVNRVFQLTELETMTSCHGIVPQQTNVIDGIVVTPVVQQQSQQQQNNHFVDHTPPAVLNTVNNKFTPDESPAGNNNALVFSGVNVLPITRKPMRYRSVLGGASAISPLTPSFGVFHIDNSSDIIHYGTPHQPLLTEANDQSLAKRVRAHVGQLINRKPTAPVQNVRRSSRLFSNNSYSVKENNKTPHGNKFLTPKSPSRKNNKRVAKTNLNKNYELNARNKEKSETVTSGENVINNNSLIIQKQCAEGLMFLLRNLGQAYLYLSQFECKKAINLLSSVPPHQFQTSWVQCMLGIAYFEMADYEKSCVYFSTVHKNEPYRLQYMDMYSTALWHLQKEVALSALSQDLIKLDKNSPITWCVAGNCFSLQKEHDTAIKFFQRAVQVDPTFPYAYTLLGHEYIMTEELDKAMSSFRNAIRLDSRHYNAWFGIGTIYSKQERYQLAEMNYLRALSINTHSSVLMCHIGVVQHALKKVNKALDTLNTAITLDPKNPLCKFHRGQVYFNLGRHAEALKELEELKEIVPKESLVYFLIGKVHKKLGNTDLALMHFSWATDLDPKGASSLKEAFDPSAGLSLTDDESPQSPTNDFPSDSNSAVPQEVSREDLSFHVLPEDSDDSL